MKRLNLKLIIGIFLLLLSLVAIIIIGITFLFFNQERNNSNQIINYHKLTLEERDQIKLSIAALSNSIDYADGIAEINSSIEILDRSIDDFEKRSAKLDVPKGAEKVHQMNLDYISKSKLISQIAKNAVQNAGKSEEIEVILKEYNLEISALNELSLQIAKEVNSTVGFDAIEIR